MNYYQITADIEEFEEGEEEEEDDPNWLLTSTYSNRRQNVMPTKSDSRHNVTSNNGERQKNVTSTERRQNVPSSDVECQENGTSTDLKCQKNVTSTNSERRQNVTATDLERRHNGSTNDFNSRQNCSTNDLDSRQNCTTNDVDGRQNVTSTSDSNCRQNVRSTEYESRQNSKSKMRQDESDFVREQKVENEIEPTEVKVVMRRQKRGPTPNNIETSNNFETSNNVKTSNTVKENSNRTSYYRFSRLIEGVASYVSARTLQEEEVSFDKDEQNESISETRHPNVEVNNDVSPSSTESQLESDLVDAKITEIFKSLESVPVSEDFRVVRRRRSTQNVDPDPDRMKNGFFQRRKQTVSGYFSDWAKWMTNVESEPDPYRG
jgi:hypothetical protein